METQIEKKQNFPNGNNQIFHQLDNRDFELVIVHPLFDRPEKKVDIENAGPMKVTKATWFALFALRAYLIIIILLAAYRFLVLAGIIKP